jgi:hypothetical protein
LKNFIKTIALLFLTISLNAQKFEHHDHKGKTNLKLTSEILNFDNSKKKIDGKRYGIELDHQNSKNHYQIYIEKTVTDTKKVIPKDLNVKKISLKYQQKFSTNQKVSFSFITIDDNLMKQTDGGNIYGVGYKKGPISFTQYLSDYDNFNVYQSDLIFGFRKKFSNFNLLGVFITKYIYLKDKDSNNFSSLAKKNYLTSGIKLHLHYNNYHIGIGTYIGKRVFAVMDNGLKVQHHSMEFKNSYMLSLGREFKRFSLYLRYATHKAKEIPIRNDGVEVENISLEFGWKF